MTPTAVSPGSVTGFFRPVYGPTAAATVSRGLAFCLKPGVTAAVAPSVSQRIELNGRPLDLPPVADVLAALAPEPLAVHLETTFPLGCGFGVSAAAALATAFAVNARFDLGRTRDELGLIAHAAEVNHRTGIGDVAAQLTGGVVYRHCRTGPFDAIRLDRLGAPTLWCRTFGPLSTKAVLTGAAAKSIADVGGELTGWLDATHESATLADLVRRSREFAERTGLLVHPGVRAAIEDVLNTGGEATMAMLGQTVLATSSPHSGKGGGKNLEPSRQVPRERAPSEGEGGPRSGPGEGRSDAPSPPAPLPQSVPAPRHLGRGEQEGDWLPCDIDPHGTRLL